MCAKIKASDETTSAQVRLTLSLLAITIYASCFTMHNCIMHLFLSPLSHMVHITFSNLSTDFFAKRFLQWIFILQSQRHKNRDIFTALRFCEICQYDADAPA